MSTGSLAPWTIHDLEGGGIVLVPVHHTESVNCDVSPPLFVHIATLAKLKIKSTRHRDTNAPCWDMLPAWIFTCLISVLQFYEQYDEDEIGALDNQDIGGVIKSDNLILTQAMEEFEKQQKIQ